MSNDIAIGVSTYNTNPGFKIKPSYLITVDCSTTKLKNIKYFITLEKPELLNGFVQAKGIFVDNMTEEEIIISFSDLLTNSKKELFLEMLLPWHKIFSIRSLIYKAK